MTLRTRGSAALDKAQRRLANLKSIDETLDLGHGLTIAAYSELINTTRAAMDAHNTLVSRIDESRRNLTAIENTLSEMSGNMLSGIAIRYGKTSTQYSKAGGSIRKNRSSSTQSAATFSAKTVPIAPSAETNGAANGRGSQAVPS
ncbi:MAG: hypothetical protein KME42_25035 [Tildeniella nuda ZEHNDER 1965/U140]|jgi:hypothetical protein|nr:hypothetical protein [Tildeniella nuda ZEHNDER 1965/U140]